MNKLEKMKELTQVSRYEITSLQKLLNNEKFVSVESITDEHLKAIEKVINILGDMQYQLHNQ